jgi:hypothetical protein
VEGGETPLGLTRGRAGRTPIEQVAELHLVGDWARLDTLTTTVSGDGKVLVRDDRRAWRVRVDTVPGEPARQSCADVRPKDTAWYHVREVLVVDR